jgi:autotransporter passenger strand-loop-strand repeat protein
LANIVVAGGQSYDLYFDPSQNLMVGQFEFNAGASGSIQIAIAAQITVSNGQQVTVQNGQTQAGITVAGNGLLMIDPGGTVDGTNVDSGGTENYSGPTLETIVSGGLEVLLSGGTASAVSRGGEEYVAFGAKALTATISSGGTQLVYGTAISTTVSVGGQEFVLSGGTASGTVASSGGVAVVESDVGSALKASVAPSQWLQCTGTVADRPFLPGRGPVGITHGRC